MRTDGTGSSRKKSNRHAVSALAAGLVLLVLALLASFTIFGEIAGVLAIAAFVWATISFIRG